jgi:Pentapeptide repeats (8 copies)
MLVREKKVRPKRWPEHKEQIRRGWMRPFYAIDWIWDWLAYGLSRWAFLEVLEYASSLSVLVAVIFYYAESGDRKKQKHYQAWQVINTAQGKGGSGGRIEALQELNADHEPLVGVDASGAFLRGIRLHGANLLRCDLSSSDLRMSDLSGANLEFAELVSANFREANLRGAILKDADLTEADLNGADLGRVDLSGAALENADLRNADLSGARYTGAGSIKGANINGVRNAPDGFAAWAMSHGAVNERE